MRYGSVCSGVEAATLAWHQMGWKCVFVSEVEPFPCAVLQERFGATAPINPLDPTESSNEDDRKMRESWIKQNEFLKTEGVLPNEGDFTKIGKKYAGQIDLLVGGTPCQDLSIAGKRAGFDGERSSLAIDFVRLAYESKCKWFVWENVPGVFSSNEGRDFATLLSLFTGTEVDVPKKGFRSAGFVCNARRDRYGVAWRTLDGQFTRTSGFPFAVPQRRRRVFLVGYFGDWTRAAEVLLEPDRVRWNTPARFKARERFAEIAGANINLAERPLCGAESNRGASNGVDAFNQAAPGDVSKTLNSAASDTDHIPCVIEQNAVHGVSFEINYGCPAEKELAHTLKVGTAPGTYSGIIQTPNGEDLSDTIDASYYKGVGARNGNERPVICRATQQGNAETMIDACPTITEAAGTSGNNQPIICLNDQGGSVMSVEQDGNAGTLRANTHGNNQIVCTNGAKIPVTSTEHANPVTCSHNGLENTICYDARGNGNGDVAPTAAGDHLNRITDYTPIVQEHIGYYPGQHHAPKPCDAPGLTTKNCSMVRGDTPLVRECYAIDSIHGNLMKSSNPNSGFHKEEIAKNQGGNLIVDTVGLDGYNAAITGDSSATLGINCGMSTGRNGVLAFEPGIAKREGGESRFSEEVSGTLRSNMGDNQTAVAIAENIIGRRDDTGGNGIGAQEELAYTPNASGVMGVCNSTVRRLLPVECERLMGFPDNWTRIPWKGKSAEECPDSPRYKACGNSMCVNVMQWIGEQIDKVEKRYNEKFHRSLES